MFASKINGSMIQRVQSIFLLLVTILHILIFFIPVFVWEGYSQPGGTAIDTKSMTALYGIQFIVLNALVILFSIFCILQFKDRKKQRTFVLVLIVMIILNTSLYLYYMISISFEGEYNLQPAKSIGIYFQLISIILCFIAARKIKKDDDLVKSVDRIR
jgi:magnesium-transporting ATPase (P-type)